METKKPESEPIQEYIYFMVGRANPPTPGHIKLMTELIKLAMRIGGLARIYLTSTSNTFQRKPGKDLDYIVSDGKRSIRKDGEQTFTDVKHSKYQNPLLPLDKRDFVIKMLKKSLENEEFPDDNIPDLNNIVILDNNCNGTHRVFNCVRRLQPDPRKIFYVMGEERDETEKQQREKHCNSIKRTALNESGEYEKVSHEEAEKQHNYNFNCITLKRNTGQGIDGVSGSKIRLLVAGSEKTMSLEERKGKFNEVYGNLLNDEDKEKLFDAIQRGIKNPASVKEYGSFTRDQSEMPSPPPSPPQSILSESRKATSYPSQVRARPSKKQKAGRKTRRKKRKGKRKTYKRKHKKNKTKRKKIKRKRNKNLKKSTKKR